MSSTRDVGRALQSPMTDVGLALCAIPEDQWFDRKSFRISPRELANVEIGLANADGGIIAVGIHDGKIEGTDSSVSHRNELSQAHVQYCQPPVPAKTKLIGCRRVDGRDDQLLIVEIPPAETVYTNVKDEVFLRIGDENRRLTYSQRQELLYDRGHGSYEGRVVDEASFSDLDHNLLIGYAQALGHPDPERLLRARGLANGEHLTVAGVMLLLSILNVFFPSPSFVCSTTVAMIVVQEYGNV